MVLPIFCFGVSIFPECGILHFSPSSCNYFHSCSNVYMLYMLMGQKDVRIMMVHSIF